MTKRLKTMIATAAATALLVTGVASAQGPRHGGPGGGFGVGGPGRGARGGGPDGRGLPLGALNLTDAQQQQIRDIRERAREAGRELRERVRRAHEAQRTAVETVPVNEGLIRSAAQELADAQTELTLRQAHVQEEIWNLLTPAQQEQATQLRGQRETRRATRQRPARQ